MNKELLTQNLNEILEGLKTVIHTANAELPAIFEEIVRWGIISSLMYMFIWLITLLVFFGLLVLEVKTRPRDDNGGNVVFFGFTSIVFLICFICKLKAFIFAYTSPKLYIIHYLKDLIQ
ncbi:MAG: hypothetical protein EBV86_08550 [Marivivens sp.]|nr:hypothetical protein [Marivivens sp.]